jgi:hypothetical protein
MADFDPDAYLAEQTAAQQPAFDPDAHLNNLVSAQQAAPAAKVYDPTEGMSTTDKVLAGAGKAFVDTGTGIKQLVAQLGHKLGLVSDGDLAKTQAEVDETKKRDAPLMATTAGTLGNMGGQAAMLAVAPEGAAGAVAGSALLAGAQPTATGESRAGNTISGAIGGGLGYGAGALAGKVIQPVKSALTETMAQHIDALRNAGVPLDLAQSTGSKAAQTLKNVVADNPLVGHSALPQEQAEAFNKAVLSEIGENSRKADPSTLAAARARIGGVFDDVAERNPIKFDDQLQNDLTQVHAGATGELSDAQMGPINKQIDNILDKAASNGGEIDGKAYQNIKGSLDRLSGGTDQALGHWARQLRIVLDNGLQRSASPDDLQALTTARQQYRALKQIEGAVNDNNDVSPAMLANRIDTKANASQTVYGKGDQRLYNLAVAGKNVLSNTKTASSGTAQRLAGMAAIGGGADALLDRDEQGHIKVGNVAKYAALGVAAPAIARAAVENPKAVNFLTGLANSKAATVGTNVLKRAGQAAGTKYGEDQLAK